MTTSTSGSGGTGTGGGGTGGTGTGGIGAGEIGAGPYFLTYSAKGPGIDSRPSVTATFSGAEIVGYVAGPSESPNRGTCVTSEAGMDALVAWGRWDDGTTAGVLNANPGIALSPTQGFHLALGILTPGASVPASGNASYALLGATHATIDSGALALGTVTGTLGVAFSGPTTKVGMDLSIDMPGDTAYKVTSMGGVASPATSEIASIGAANPARLGGQIPVAVTGAACAGGTTCKATFQGFMAGPDADRIGLSFVLSAGFAGTQVRGVVVFTRQ
jgi:hypothetical protein